MNQTPTAAGRLCVEGRQSRTTVDADPGGMLIGRDPACDLVLADPSVSRRHAYLYRDPLGQWTVKDLDSHNGTWLDGRRIGSEVLLAGQELAVGVYRLRLAGEPRPAGAGLSVTTTVLEDDTPAGPPVTVAGESAILTGDSLRRLDRLAEVLALASGQQQLFAEACRRLAEGPESLATILRVPADPSAGGTVEVLAYHVQSGSGEPAAGGPLMADIHLSRRVLAALSKTDGAVMARGLPRDNGSLGLTVVDPTRPRAVLCSPVTRTVDATVALYLDVDAALADERLLDFVRAAARHIQHADTALTLAAERARHEVIRQQLEQARGIQQRLTPPPRSRILGVELAVCCRPALWLGGDYCDFWQTPAGRLAFVLADVAGHGLDAALLMANVHAATRILLTVHDDLARAAAQLNDHLLTCLPEGRFVTMILGLLDPASGDLTFVNAGHHAPYLVRRDDAQPVGAHVNPPMGVSSAGMAVQSAHLDPGDCLVLFTDGVLEAESPEGEQFGRQRVCDCLRSAGPAPGAIVEMLDEQVRRFRADLPQGDDITLLALQIPAAGSD